MDYFCKSSWPQGETHSSLLIVCHCHKTSLEQTSDFRRHCQISLKSEHRMKSQLNRLSPSGEAIQQLTAKSERWVIFSNANSIFIILSLYWQIYFCSYKKEFSSLQVILYVYYNDCILLLIFILLYVLLSFSPNKLRSVTWIQLKINKFIQFFQLVYRSVLLSQFAVFSAAIHYKSLCSGTWLIPNTIFQSS